MSNSKIPPIEEDDMPVNNVLEESINSDNYCLASCPKCYGKCNKEPEHASTHYCNIGGHIWESKNCE